MKTFRTNLALILAALMAVHPAMAAKIGDDTLTVGRPGSVADKTIKMGAGQLIWSEADDKLKFSNDAGGTLKDIGSGGGGAGGITLLSDTDADFEAASLASWVASAGAFSKDETNELFGAKSGLFNASASGQTLSNTLVTPPIGLQSTNGFASCWFKTTATDYKIQAVDSSAVVLGERVIPALSASQEIGMSFPIPPSGQIRLRIISQSDAADISIDNCFLGSTAVHDVSQAKFLGAVKLAPACNWSKTGSTTPGSFSVDGDCTYSAEGSALAPSTNLPAMRFASLPPGELVVHFIGKIRIGSGTSGRSCVTRLYDGTDAMGSSQGGASTAAETRAIQATHVGRKTYTTAQSNITVELQVTPDNAADTCYVDPPTASASDSAMLIAYYYPSGSQQAMSFETTAQSWSGYHDSTCLFSRTNTAYGAASADTTCGFTERKNTNFGTVTSQLSGSDKLPGIVWDAPGAKDYFVCAEAQQSNSAGVAAMAARLSDLSSVVIAETGFVSTAANTEQPFALCGIYRATAAGSQTVRFETKAASNGIQLGALAGAGTSTVSINWSIVAINQQMPAPLLVGGVTSSSAGIERVLRATFTNSGSCAVASQSGGVSGVTDPGAGLCGITFSAGTFSGTPACTCSTTTGICRQNVAPTSSGVTMNTVQIDSLAPANLSNADLPFDMVCIGPR